MTENSEKNGAIAFFDVDGTLVWHDFEKMRNRKSNDASGATAIKPSPAVYDAFRRMRENGNLTFICTGRTRPFIMPSLYALEPDGFVAAAGAYVAMGDVVVRDEHIEHDLLLETVRRFVAAGLDLTVESTTQNAEVKPSGTPQRFPGSALARTADEFARLMETTSYAKFCTSGLTFEDLVPVMDFCKEHYTICDLQGGVLEFSIKGVDKGSGIEAVLRYLGRGNEQTFAFGDSENDLPMARAVETFVAMGDALPNVRERAGYVTSSAADDGVPAALAHFGLI